MVLENAVSVSELYVQYHIFRRSKKKKPFGEFNEFLALKNLNFEIPEGASCRTIRKKWCRQIYYVQSIAGLLRPQMERLEQKEE